MNLALPRQFAPPKNTLALGVILAILSNVMFAMVYAYSKWLPPLTGTAVFLWRMVMMWGCLVVLISVLGKWERCTGRIISGQRGSGLGVVTRPHADFRQSIVAVCLCTPKRSWRGGVYGLFLVSAGDGAGRLCHG